MISWYSRLATVATRLPTLYTQRSLLLRQISLFPWNKFSWWDAHRNVTCTRRPLLTSFGSCKHFFRSWSFSITFRPKKSIEGAWTRSQGFLLRLAFCILSLLFLFTVTWTGTEKQMRSFFLIINTIVTMSWLVGTLVALFAILLRWRCQSFVQRLILWRFLYHWFWGQSSGLVKVNRILTVATNSLRFGIITAIYFCLIGRCSSTAAWRTFGVLAMVVIMTVSVMVVMTMRMNRRLWVT